MQGHWYNNQVGLMQFSVSPHWACSLQSASSASQLKLQMAWKGWCLNVALKADPSQSIILHPTTLSSSVRIKVSYAKPTSVQTCRKGQAQCRHDRKNEKKIKINKKAYALHKSNTVKGRKSYHTHRPQRNSAPQRMVTENGVAVVRRVLLPLCGLSLLLSFITVPGASPLN